MFPIYSMNNKKTIIALMILVFSTGVFSQLQGIEVVDVEARLENENLVIEIIALNKEAERRDLKVTTNFFGLQEKNIEELFPNTTKKLTYTVHNVKSGKIQIGMDDISSKFVEIIIPADFRSNPELQVKEITRQTFSIEENSNESNQIDQIQIAIIIAAIFALVILIQQIFFKTKKEKALESNAELIKEAKEAKQNQDPKKIKI